MLVNLSSTVPRTSYCAVAAKSAASEPSPLIGWAKNLQRFGLTMASWWLRDPLDRLFFYCLHVVIPQNGRNKKGF